MIVTKTGKFGCTHKWVFYDSANTQFCVLCGRSETPDP